MTILAVALACVSVAAVLVIPACLYVFARHIERTQTVGGHSVQLLTEQSRAQAEFEKRQAEERKVRAKLATEFARRQNPMGDPE